MRVHNERPIAPPCRSKTTLQRFNGIEFAKQFGYNESDLTAFAGKVEIAEKLLVNLFGPKVREYFFGAINFGSYDCRIGTAAGSLLVNPGRIGPVDLIMQGIELVLHEYAHVLTLNHKILKAGLPADLSRHINPTLKETDATGFFASGLKAGMRNPFISGLKDEEGAISKLIDMIPSKYSCDHDTSLMLENMVYTFIAELAAERIVDLMNPKPGIIRLMLMKYLSKFFNLKKEDAGQYFPNAAYAYVYAAKTGNSKLLEVLKQKEGWFGEGYPIMRDFLMELWDQISLK